MDIDFLEIGTSNFDTCIQKCSDEQFGISVEPLQFYLDDLPNKLNVKKIHAAITHNKPSNMMNIFYIPPNIVDEQNLPQWFKGCNKIGNYHPLHIKHNVQKYVKVEEVVLLNVDELLIQQNVRAIKYLKIDTEGHDCIILDGFYEYLKNKPSEYCPLEIMFETNEHTSSVRVNDIIKKFSQLGYIVLHRGYDTLLKYQSGDNMHSF